MEPDINRAAAITGIGLLTPLGRSAGETWNALLAGRSIADHARIAGFSGPERAVAMAEHAAAEALANARWTAAECGANDTGLFVGTSKGTIESWMQSAAANARAMLPLGLAQIDTELSRKFKFGLGPHITISAACSSGLHALLRAAMAIESGEVRRALVVGVEASVHPLFISSFKRLGVLAPEGHGCRPFDHERRGFILSEAAGVVCLESADKLIGRPIVRIDRWAAGADGTHLTGGDPEGVTLRKILTRVAAPGCDLVHAHATGTIVNDPVELAAIGATCGQTRPYLFSHKGALGHSLGAAGMVAVVLNCLSHVTGKVPPNVRSGEPLPMEGLRFPRATVQTPIRRSIAFAAGFGGPLAAVGLVSC